MNAHLKNSKKCKETIDFENFITAITEFKKDERKEADAKRKKACRELKNESEKKIEQENNAKRMKTRQELMNDSKKKIEKESDAKNHKAIRKRKMVEDSEGFKENQRNQRKRLREIEKANCGRLERLRKFRHAIKYGAIFVCSSCHQRLFENGVTLIS